MTSRGRRASAAARASSVSVSSFAAGERTVSTPAARSARASSAGSESRSPTTRFTGQPHDRQCLAPRSAATTKSRESGAIPTGRRAAGLPATTKARASASTNGSSAKQKSGPMGRREPICIPSPALPVRFEGSLAWRVLHIRGANLSAGLHPAPPAASSHRREVCVYYPCHYSRGSHGCQSQYE